MEPTTKKIKRADDDPLMTEITEVALKDFKIAIIKMFKLFRKK